MIARTRARSAQAAVTTFPRLGALALLLLALLACDAGGSASDPDRPASDPSPATARPSSPGRLNLVLITLDTARADAFGAYGQALPTSPNIDRMATEGVLFQDVMSASPSTLPSHATILTGLFPTEHGVRSNTGFVLGDDRTTLAEILAGRGYATAAEIAAPVIGRRAGLAQGFDRYREPGDFDIVRKKIVVNDPAAPGGQRTIEAHDREGADITKRGLEFLDRHARSSRPFFLWLHYFDPHAAYQAPIAFAKGFEQSPYHAEIHYTDHQVGRVLDHLRALGLRERTLVVLTADHGEGLGEHEELTHSFLVYESTLRVPLIFWGPDSVPRGRRIPTPVRTADIAPTVLDWLRAPIPTGLQGRSLRPIVDRRPDATPPGPGYGESAEPLALFGSSMLRTIRVGPWKYIHKLEPELYRLDQDPGETRNLSGADPERLRAMREALVDFVGEAQPSLEERTRLDAAQRAQLQALGYIAVETPDSFRDLDDLATLRGPDPTASQPDHDRFLAAHRRLYDGESEQAIEGFHALLARHPESVAIEDGLLEALAAAARWSDLVPMAERAIARDATHQLANESLGAALVALGRDEAAEAHWRRAADVFPCDSDMASRLGLFLAERHREADRVEALRGALARCPDSGTTRNDLAWTLATTPEPGLRDAAEALALARAAVAGPGGERPDFLDTLACAQAATGDFQAALASLDRAFAALRLREYPPALVSALEAHREAFTRREASCD